MVDHGKIPNLPSLDARCGANFRFIDLIECGETFQKLRPDNVPQVLKTYAALELLAEKILDPVVEKFGEIELTYCMSCRKLHRHIKKSISPSLDQHASYELNSKGKQICLRGGAAVDFYCKQTGSRAMAQWVTKHTPFDRLYYYGDKKPFHVSVGPENSRQIVLMRQSKSTGKNIPKRVAVEQFADMLHDLDMVIAS